MDFLEVCGLRRSIRIFDKSKCVEREKIQRILEVVRTATTCPGNLQPWRAITVEQAKLSKQDRDKLLAADNYQGAHQNAAVWIYWFADPEYGTPERFRQTTHELIDCGALPTFYGWTHDTIDSSILKGEPAPEGMPGIDKLIHKMPSELSYAIARQETVGACMTAVLAAVNEGLGTCLHMVSTADKLSDVRQLLKIPETWQPVWLQLVGYPLEDREAGGQRPRLPFKTMFFDGNCTTPFARDRRVVEELAREGLLREQAPKTQRFNELKELAAKLGLPL